MKNPGNRSINRRAILTSAVVGSIALSTPRILAAQDSTPASDATPADGEWSFTDDKGVTIELESVPQNLVIDVNAAAPLWDFGIKPTALFGWNVLADGSFGDAGGNIDPSGIATVGDVNETIRIEDLVAQDPDVVITLTWTPDVPNEYWSISDEVVEQVVSIAPILAMSATGRADDNTMRFAELAESLGADLATPELVAAEEEYRAALTRFEEMTAAKSELSVLFIAPTEATVYVAYGPDWADLNMYNQLGLNIIEPEASAGEFWQSINHEQALMYPSDVIFMSTRAEAMSIDEVKASPTWSQHPAVKAGQIYGWNQDFIQSYQGMAIALVQVTESMNGSEKL